MEAPTYASPRLPEGIGCPVCGKPLSFRSAVGRKSKKPFLMLVCLVDGRHFRAFINDREYVRGVFDLIEDRPAALDDSL